MRKVYFNCEIEVKIDGKPIDIPIIDIVEEVNGQNGKCFFTRVFMQLKNKDYLLLKTLTTPVADTAILTNEIAIELATHLQNQCLDVPMEDYYYAKRRDFEKAGSMMWYYTKKEFKEQLK